MPTPTLLAEQLFLLTHDDASGKATASVALENGLAGALLLDLAAEALVEADGKNLVAVSGTASHPLLAATHEKLLASNKPRTAQHWVNRLPSAMKPLATTVGRALVERGVLAEHHAKMLGLFPATSWPELDPATEAELRQRLTSVLVDGVPPDARTAQLVALLSPLDLVRTVVGEETRKAATARAKDIAKRSMESTAVSSAVSASVEAVQVAVLTAIIVPTIITTS